MTTNTAAGAASPEPHTFAGALGLTPEKMKDLLAKQRRRDQRRRRKIALPPPRPERPEHPLHVLGSDGRLCVSVRLRGKNGYGHRVVLDELDWNRVRRTHGDAWTLQEVRAGGRLYVKGLGQARGFYLARIVAQAAAGQTVMLRDGDPLNLARGNLEVLEKAVAVQRALRDWREVGGSPQTPRCLP